MAKWIIIRDGVVKLYYENLITDVVYPLGTERPEIPDTMIVDWIFKEAEPQYGDRIHLSNGALLIYQRSDARA